LPDANAYGRVFKQAKRSGDKCFTVLCRSRASGPARLGLAVSKKNCKLASGRNRIKRLVRDSFRHNKAALAGIDIVVMNTRATHSMDNRTITKSLEQHWERCRADLSRAARN